MSYLGRDNRYLQGFILQNARAVCIETYEIVERVELPPSDVVIPTIGVNLEVMDLPQPTQIRYGIVPGLSNAFPHEVTPWFSYQLQTLTRNLPTNTSMVPPVKMSL